MNHALFTSMNRCLALSFFFALTSATPVLASDAGVCFQGQTCSTNYHCGSSGGTCVDNTCSCPDAGASDPAPPVPDAGTSVDAGFSGADANVLGDTGPDDDAGGMADVGSMDLGTTGDAGVGMGQPSDDGCSVSPGQGPVSVLWLLVGLFVMGRIRRRR